MGCTQVTGGKKSKQQQRIRPNEQQGYDRAFYSIQQRVQEIDKNYKYLTSEQTNQYIYELQNDNPEIQQLLFCTNDEKMKDCVSNFKMLKSYLDDFIIKNSQILDGNYFCQIINLSKENVIMLQVPDCELITQDSFEDILRDMQYKDFENLITSLCDAILALNQIKFILGNDFFILNNIKNKRICIYPIKLSLEQPQTEINIESTNIYVIGKKLISMINSSPNLIQKMNSCYRQYILDMAEGSQVLTTTQLQQKLFDFEKSQLPVLIQTSDSDSPPRIKVNNSQNNTYQGTPDFNNSLPGHGIDSARGGSYNELIQKQNVSPQIELNNQLSYNDQQAKMQQPNPFIAGGESYQQQNNNTIGMRSDNPQQENQIVHQQGFPQSTLPNTHNQYQQFEGLQIPYEQVYPNQSNTLNHPSNQQNQNQASNNFHSVEHQTNIIKSSQQYQQQQDIYVSQNIQFKSDQQSFEQSGVIDYQDSKQGLDQVATEQGINNNLPIFQSSYQFNNNNHLSQIGNIQQLGKTLLPDQKFEAQHNENQNIETFGQNQQHFRSDNQMQNEAEEAEKLKQFGNPSHHDQKIYSQTNNDQFIAPPVLNNQGDLKSGHSNYGVMEDEVVQNNNFNDQQQGFQQVNNLRSDQQQPTYQFQQPQTNPNSYPQQQTNQQNLNMPQQPQASVNVSTNQYHSQNYNFENSTLHQQYSQIGQKGNIIESEFIQIPHQPSNYSALSNHNQYIPTSMTNNVNQEDFQKVYSKVLQKENIIKKDEQIQIIPDQQQQQQIFNIQDKNTNQFQQNIINKNEEIIDISKMDVEEEQGAHHVYNYSYKTNLQQKQNPHDSQVEENKLQGDDQKMIDEQGVQNNQQENQLNQLIVLGDDFKNADSQEKSEAYYNKGLEQLEQQNIDQAINCFDLSILYDDNQIHAYILLGEIYNNIKKEYAKSILTIYKLLEKYQNIPEAHLIIGNALLNNGSYNEAEFHFQTCISLNEYLGECYNQLGNIQIRNLNPKEALNLYKQALNSIQHEKVYLKKIVSKNICYTLILLKNYSFAKQALEWAYPDKQYDIEYDNYNLLLNVEVQNNSNIIQEIYLKYKDEKDYLPLLVNLFYFISKYKINDSYFLNITAKLMQHRGNQHGENQHFEFYPDFDKYFNQNNYNNK